MQEEQRRAETLRSLVPDDAVFLIAHGMYWRPSSGGYTNDAVDAGFYPPEKADRYDGHSTSRSAREALSRYRLDGPTLLTNALDEVARLRDALDLVRRAPIPRVAEFARRVLAGEPPEIARGCIVVADYLPQPDAAWATDLEDQRRTLARGVMALMAAHEIGDPHRWRIEGPYAWSPCDPNDHRQCWELKEDQRATTGTVSLIRVLRPTDAECTREDGERMIAAARAGLDLAKAVLASNNAAEEIARVRALLVAEQTKELPEGSL